MADVILEFGQSRVVINHHGATVVSWSVNGSEKLFVSSKAILDGSKAIRASAWIRTTVKVIIHFLILT